MKAPTNPGPDSPPFRRIDPWDDHWGEFGDWGDDGDNFPGGGLNSHQSALGWTDALVQETEASTSPTKPKNIENNGQTEVSNVFTPLEIMLYNNGHGRGQVDQLHQVQGAVTTALKTKGGRNGA